MRRRSLLLALLLAVPSAALSEGDRIVVVMSHGSAPYQQALVGFREQLERQGVRAQVDVVEMSADTAEPSTLSKVPSASAVLTLGARATRETIRLYPDTRLIAAMILGAGDIDGAVNAGAVVLEFPLATQMQWLQKILPRHKTVGVLFGAERSRARIEEAQRVAAQLGLQLHAEAITTPQEIPEALARLAKHADVLWGIPDAMVLNAQTAETILLFCLRNRIAFMAPSEVWVKAGALFALDRDYADLGAQAAELTAQVVRGAEPKSLPVATPRKVAYTVNLKAARHLRIELDPKLIRAARQGYE